MNNIVIKNNLLLHRKTKYTKLFQKSNYCLIFKLFLIMLKKTFYLFSVSLLFFGATSCKDYCQDKTPISWGNRGVARFEFDGFKLSINANFYLVNHPKLDAYRKVGPDLPITKFSEIFDRPQVSGVTQNSELKVTSTINVACVDNKDKNEPSMYQTYKKMGPNPLSVTPKKPASGNNSYYNFMEISELYGAANYQYFWCWVSSRGAQNQNYTLNT